MKNPRPGVYPNFLFLRRLKLSVRMTARWCRPGYFKDWYSPAVRGGHTLSFCVAARTR
jgi:hypothetical protein